MKKIRLGDPVKHIRWKNFIGTAEDYYIENGKKYLIVRLAPNHTYMDEYKNWRYLKQ